MKEAIILKRKTSKILHEAYHFRPIDRFIFTVMPALIIVMMLSISILTNNISNTQKNYVQENMEIIALNQETQFNSYVDGMTNALRIIASSDEIYTMDEDIQHAYFEKNAHLLNFDALFVLSPDGEYTVLKDIPGIRHNTHEFKSHALSHLTYVDVPITDEDGDIHITLTTAIYDEDGNNVGALCGVVSLVTTKFLMNSYSNLFGGDYIVIGSNGEYLAMDGWAEIEDGTNIYNKPNTNPYLVQETFKTQRDQSGVMSYEGVECVAYAAYFEGFDWVLLQVVPMKYAVGSYDTVVNLAILQYAIAAILIVFTIRMMIRSRERERRIYRDALTGINNRAAVQALIQNIDGQTKDRINVIYFDLNNFKIVNDTYSHDKGDELLINFAKTLQKVFGQIGFVGRIGGDEFVVFLANHSDEEIVRLAQSVNKRLKQIKISGIDGYDFVCSYGYDSREIGDTTSITENLVAADNYMYIFKRSYKEKKKQNEERSANN